MWATSIGLLLSASGSRIDIDTSEGSARFGALVRFSTVLADFEHVFRRGRWVTEEGKRVFRGGREGGKEYFETLHRYLLYYARDAYEEFEGELSVDLTRWTSSRSIRPRGLSGRWSSCRRLLGPFPLFAAGKAQHWFLTRNLPTLSPRAL